MSDRGRRSRAAVLIIGCTLLSGLAPAAPGDPDDSPAALLEAKGLRRVGSTYRLAEEVDFDGRIERLRKVLEGWKRDRGRLEEEVAALERWQRRYRELTEPPPRNPRFDHPGPPPGEPFLRPPGDGPPPPPDDMGGFGPSDRDGPPRKDGDRRQLDRLRTDLEARITLAGVTIEGLSGRLEATARRLRRLRDEALDLRARIAARHAELAADPEVARALRAMDATVPTTIRLSPIEVGSEELRSLEALLALLARATGPAPGPAPRIDLKGVSRLRGLVGAADLLLQELAVDFGRLATLEHDRASRRKLLASGSKAAPARTESLLADEAQSRTTTGLVLDRLAADQDRFLRIVKAARAEGDAGAGTPAPDPKSTRPSARDPSADTHARRIRELEKAIRSERVPLDVDKNLLWVDATIDGSHRLPMLVAPEADLVLSARTASEAGIRPDPGEPVVDYATIDGRRFAAHRARIGSVQVGPFVVHDVECLVMPTEFGDAPPTLGGAFFKRFATAIDSEAGTLTLTQVQVKPNLRGGAPRR